MDIVVKRSYEKNMATNAELKALLRHLEQAEKITEMWEDALDLSGGDGSFWDLYDRAFGHEWRIREELITKLYINAYGQIDSLDLRMVLDEKREELKAWINALP